MPAAADAGALLGPKIPCLVTHPIAEEDRQRYANLLAQIKARGDATGVPLTPPVTVFDLESAALNARKMIELVALGSLVTNRSAAERVSSALQKKDWNEARKILRSVNPQYWPVPTTKHQAAPNVFEAGDVTEPYLTEEKAGHAWGFLSTLLHAVNPYVAEPDVMESARRVRKILTEITVLISHHEIHLADTNYMAIALINAQPGNFVQVALFERVKEGE